tara:strand:- start:2943 stop:3107 length:165 start_codon:yes stop_codon:yes gene_type:complete
MNNYFRIPDRELTPPDYDDKEYPVLNIQLHNCMTCGEVSQGEFCDDFCHESYLS